jgi:cytochrome c oxidase subunit 1
MYAKWNLISTVGSWFIAAGILCIIGNVIYSMMYGEKAPSNPWGGRTLEWATESPPLLENFASSPTVNAPPYEYGLGKPVLVPT